MQRLLAELPVFPGETELSEGKPRRYSTENSRNHPHRGFRQSRSGTDQGEIRDKQHREMVILPFLVAQAR